MIKMITNKELIEKAKNILNPKKINSSLGIQTGYTGCALLTKKDNIYTGVNIDLSCGIGFCAEHSAIATMITNNEFDIKKIVAYSSIDKIIPPCGRCRELMSQISKYNYNSTEVIISNNKSKKLKELLPLDWKKYFK
jgi:cytidine deaminase